uniref:RNA-dependent RNA polymerase n=1 Tax=Ui-te-Rangiora virus TaxID=2707277 RepID=A0A6H0DIH5_9VIRU|nr:MAG: RNA-dependent RNA polymerase [Ui-te-Rangiora virus]
MRVIAEAVRASKLLGSLRTVESGILNLESRSSCSKQSLSLQKIQERIPSLLFLEVGGFDMIVSPESLVAYLKRAGPFGLNQSNFTKLQKQAANLREKNIGVLMDLLVQLLHLGHPIHSLFGIRIPLEKTIVHCFRDRSRFEHCLGLADAVHMSLYNLNIQVCLPWKTRISVRNNDVSSFARIHFKSLTSRPTCWVTRMKTKNRKCGLLLHYLKVFPKGLQEKDYVKMIKLSLTGLFSEKSNQELPIGYPENAVPIFPLATQKRLDRCLRSNPSLRVRLYFNLIQSKALCAPVGEDMIKESYEKHFDSLCRPVDECLVVPEEYLKKLREYGQNIGRRMQKHYDPFSTVIPNTHSTLETTRRDGGAVENLSAERSLCQGSRLRHTLDKACGASQPQRIEPFVIGLFGPPGCGKTTTVSTLINQLGREYFPQFQGNQLCYSRSCSSKHWDGYDNQPIVVLDDFGQDLADRSDIVEFEQLVSTNRYLVPMAELNEKGRCFNSPIIILTSNCAYGSNFNVTTPVQVVEEPIAVWRRVAVPLVLSNSNSFNLIDRDATCFGPESINVWGKKYAASGTHYTNACTYPRAIAVDNAKHLRWSEAIPQGSDARVVLKYIIERFAGHIEYDQKFLSPEWCQNISSQRIRYSIDPDSTLVGVTAETVKVPYLKEDYSLYQTFSSLPPADPPRVKAIALAEPLKVRMITIAEAETKALQPMQIALFKVLQEMPQFCLSNGCSKSVLWKDFMKEGLPWIEKIEAQIQGMNLRKLDNEKWLSGDYTAATDNFPMSVTNALLEGILEYVDHPSTREWARYECSNHIIEYPGGKLGEQTSGQLMGSLLSFPLLCFLNDFIVSESGFQPGKYLINGDDVVACGPIDVIDSWKLNAPKVGLSLSLGKNFVDKHFCTVNSQLFYDGNCLHTGKVSCQTRIGATIGFCFQETQFYFGASSEIRDEFIRRNLIPLRKTIRSLKVPTSKGGLSLVSDDESMTAAERSLAKRTYLHDLISPFLKSLPVPGFTGGREFGGCKLRAVPFPSFDEEEDESVKTLISLRTVFGGSPLPDDSGTGDLTRIEVDKALKKVIDKGGEKELKQLLSIPFSRYPSRHKLGFKVKYYFVEEHYVSNMIRQTLPIVLNILLRKLNGSDLEILESNELLIQEVDFPLLTGHLAQWIEDHFNGEESPSEPIETEIFDESELESEFLDYTVSPRRSIPADAWLKSLLQIKEFADPLPPVSNERISGEHDSKCLCVGLIN